MRIIVDAMGGDNAPACTVRGAVLAAQAYSEDIILVGDESKIRAILKEDGALDTPHLTIVHAPDEVDMHDDPTTVLRNKPQSSMAVALKMVKNGEGDHCYSYEELMGES